MGTISSRSDVKKIFLPVDKFRVRTTPFAVDAHTRYVSSH